MLGGVAMERGVRFVEEAADMGRFPGGTALYALCAGDRRLGRRESAVFAARASTAGPSGGRKRDRSGGIYALAHDTCIGAGGLAGETRAAAAHRQQPVRIVRQTGLLGFLFFLWGSDPGVDASPD